MKIQVQRAQACSWCVFGANVRTRRLSVRADRRPCCRSRGPRGRRGRAGGHRARSCGGTSIWRIDRCHQSVAGLLVGAGQRRGDNLDPAVEEGMDVTQPESVAHPLEARRVVAGGKAVGGLGEAELLALGPFVAVDPDLCRDRGRLGCSAIVLPFPTDCLRGPSSCPSNGVQGIGCGGLEPLSPRPHSACTKRDLIMIRPTSSGASSSMAYESVTD